MVPRSASDESAAPGSGTASADPDDYGQYVRDAENAGQDDIARYFRDVIAQDSRCAHQCHEFLARLGGTDNTSPQG